MTVAILNEQSMRGVQLFLISRNHWNSLLESMNQVKVLEFKISTVILVHFVYCESQDV